MFKILFTYLVFIFFIVSCAATPVGNYNNEQGRALAAEGKWKEAIEFFKKANDENSNSHYLNNIGRAYLELDDFENASKYYKKAIDALPYNPLAYQNIRNLYQDNGRLAELIEHIESRVEKRPNDILELNELGILYAHDGRLEDAIRVASKAIIIEKNKEALIILKNNLNIYRELNIGVIKYNDGDYPEALAALNKAKELIVGNNNIFIIEKYLDLARSKLKKTAD